MLPKQSRLKSAPHNEIHVSSASGTPGLKYDDAVGWEEEHYQHSKLRYRSEAYHRFKSLRGALIPHSFAAGTLLLAQRVIAAHALLTEYPPDAKIFKNVEPRVVVLPLAKSLALTRRLCARRLNPGNILLVPGDRPTRAIVISLQSLVYVRPWNQTRSEVCMKRRLHRFWGMEMSLLEPG